MCMEVQNRICALTGLRHRRKKKDGLQSVLLGEGVNYSSSAVSREK